MKLMMIIVRYLDGEGTVQALVENGYRVTRMASAGGFLRHGNVTLLTGVEDSQVQNVVEMLPQVCRPAEDGQHRATVFIVDMPYFEQI
jgi:uncharacterized protein YaaQ